MCFVNVYGQGLYIARDIRCDITCDLVLKNSHPSRHWLKYTASVPKGFLRYHVLKLLKVKPMSGSEIMEEIEKQTAGRWTPSPGSVYPLLAWFKDNSYTKEVPTEEIEIKRYTLTEKGEKFFEEQTILKEKLQKKLEFFAPPFLSGFWFSSNGEKLSELHEPARRFVRSLFGLRMTLEENPTDEMLEEVRELLNNTAEKIEKISKKKKQNKMAEDCDKHFAGGNVWMS